MKRFTIILSLLSLSFVSGCMHHGHYYNEHRPYSSYGYYESLRHSSSTSPQYPCVEPQQRMPHRAHHRY